MTQSSFFLLESPVSATEINSFLCRVVTFKASPLTQFAPFSLPGTPSHNTNDILPSILPEPTLTTPIKVFRGVTPERRVSVRYPHLAGFRTTRSSKQSRTLESESIKRYVLTNPKHCFEQLMENENYSRDVRKLLKKARPHHAYLVTGFLTTTKSVWKTEGSQDSKRRFNISIPISTVLRPAVGDAARVDGALFIADLSRGNDERFVAEEEIFAVSYSVARLSYKPSGPKTLFTSTPSIGPPKRAKAHHLAFRHQDEEEEGEEIGRTPTMRWDNSYLASVRKMKVLTRKLSFPVLKKKDEILQPDRENGDIHVVFELG